MFNDFWLIIMFKRKMSMAYKNRLGENVRIKKDVHNLIENTCFVSKSRL